MSDQERFDEWMNELPRERQLIAFQRGCVIAGIPHSLKAEGGIVIEGELDDPELQAAVHQEFLRMFVDEGFQQLIAEGKIEASGVDENGEVMYTAVETV